MKWDNKLDPNRNGVWIQCQSNDVQFDTLLPADCDSCSVNGLPDGTYNVTVAAVSESGDTALVEQGNGRPYTENHEAVLSFTRGISKYVFLKDNLVLFAGSKTDEMVDFVLHYTGTDGKSHEYSLTDNMGPYTELSEVLRGVDASQPVTLARRGLLEGCPDTITFPAYTLDPTAMSMASDFQGRLLERYGEVDLTRTELELDYDLSSLEDIIYFPNLQKLVLGKNRYYTNPNPYFVPTSQLTGGWSAESRTYFSIDLLHELNPDFVIENYKGHYGIDQWTYDFVTDMGVRTVPEDFQLLGTEGFVVTADGEEVDGSTLFDDDVTTIWEAPVTQTQASHDLIIDMQEAKADHRHGLRLHGRRELDEPLLHGRLDPRPRFRRSALGGLHHGAERALHPRDRERRVLQRQLQLRPRRRDPLLNMPNPGAGAEGSALPAFPLFLSCGWQIRLNGGSIA